MGRLESLSMRNDQIASARVLIIQSQIKQYRVPFFDHLHQTLALDNISLRVAYSDPSRNEEKKGDNQDLPASYGVKVKSFRFLREAIFYQPLLLEILAADMIVVEQASKHLLNYLLLLLSALGAKKVAFWGHGRNCQRPGQGLAEWLKNITLNRVDWWFAYTDRTARYLIGQGVTLTKITSVQNSVDADAFRKECSAFSRAELQKTRSQLGIDESAKVALFCAGITREKLPEFLIHSARPIRRELPNFELLVVGGGPEQGIIEAAARDSSFIHFVGPQFGREKALYFRIADAFLMPGPLGLAILDAFSAGLPVVTSTAPFHGPEIDYLEEGRNGLVTPLEIGAYTRADRKSVVEGKR